MTSHRAVSVALLPTGHGTDDAEAQAADEQPTPVPIEEVVVSGTNQSRYVVHTTDALTGLDLGFLENPRNVSELPEQLAGNVSVFVSYSESFEPNNTHTDSELSTGTMPVGVPENAFKVYASYEVQGGRREGIGSGGGVYYESDRFADNGNNIGIGDITLADASVRYTIAAPESVSSDDTIRFQLAAKNVLDDEYYGGGSGGRLRMPLGTERTVFGSMSRDF